MRSWAAAAVVKAVAMLCSPRWAARSPPAGGDDRQAGQDRHHLGHEVTGIQGHNQAAVALGEAVLVAVGGQPAGCHVGHWRG